jgi:hypothetical protein
VGPLDPDLSEAFVALAAQMRHAAAPWWIVGSAAVVLHGAQTAVADIDLLLDATDACAVLGAAGIAGRRGSGSRQFRSAVFGTVHAATFPVDVMGGLTIRASKGWRPVRLRTREPVMVAGATIWVPARIELIALLHRFGREKDLARADLLEALPQA